MNILIEGGGHLCRAHAIHAPAAQEVDIRTILAVLKLSSSDVYGA